MADEIKLNNDENIVEKEEVISELKEEAPAEQERPWYTRQDAFHTKATPWMDVINAAYDDPYEDHSNLTHIRKENPELNQEMRKYLTHGTAYMSGAENAVINKLEAPKWDDEFPTMLTPEEAHTLSKELGHELKFEKDVTEGNVRFSVDQQLRKSAMEKALAEYQSTGSHGVLQDMSLIGSAISGSFGGIETAATIATSALLYPFVGAAVAAGVTGLAKVPGLATAARGVRLAQQALALEKKAQLASNNAYTAARLLGKAGRYADIAKKRGAAASIAYDSLRYTQNATGKAASLFSTMIPFAVDGALSEIPREILILQNEELTHSEDFTMSDAVNECLLAGTFAGVLPPVGRMFKGVGSVAGKAWNKVAERHAAESLKKATLAAAKGHEGEAKAFLEAGTQVNNTIKEVSDMVRNPLPPSVEQAVRVNEATNFSETEKSDIISFIVQTIERGGNVANVDALPHKGKLLSHVPYLRKMFEEGGKIDLTASEVIAQLEQLGIKVEKNLGRSQTGAIFEDSVRSGKMISTKLANDTGLLGKHAAHGFNLKQATEFLIDTYKYHMMDDLAAGERAHAYIQRMEDAWFRLSYILEKYNYYFDVNKGTHEMLDVHGNQIYDKYGKRITWAPYNQQLYELADGRIGKLDAALNELLDMMLPDEEVQLLRRGRYIENNPSAARHYPPEEVEAAKAAVKKRQEMLDVIMDTDGNKIDLKGRDITQTSEGRAETSFLGRFLNSLSDSIEENRRLFDTDKVLQQEFEGKADELWYKANIGDNEIDETLGMLPSRQTVEDLKFASTTVEGSAQRLAKSREEYTGFVDDARNMEVVTVFNGLVAKMTKSFKQGERQLASFFNINTEIIAHTAAALKENFKGLRQNLFEALESNNFLGSMKEELAKLYDQIDAIRSVSEISDGIDGLTDDLELQLKEKLAGYARRIRSHDNPVRMELVGRLIKPLQDVAGEDIITEGQIQKIVRESLHTLADKIENDMYFVEQLIGKATVAEGETAISGADVLLDEALKPGFEKMAMIMMDAQNQAIRNQLNLMKDFKELYDAPALAKELLYSKSTFTPVNKKGTALSIENLSDITGVYRRFRKSLAERTSSTEMQNGESLLNYLDNVDNNADIINALYYVSKYTPAELTEKGVKLNDKAARVAEAFNEIMAEEGLSLHTVGSNKTGRVSFLNKKAMSIASYVLPENAAPRAVNNLTGIAYRLSGEAQAYVQRFFGGNTIEGIADQYVPASRKAAQARQDQANANFAKVLFAYIDLDSHFNPDDSLRVSLNTIRDAVMANDVSEIEIKDLEKGLRLISDGIFGNEKKSGLIQRIQTGTRNAQDAYACKTSKYIEDVEDMVRFKDDDSALAMMKLLGYDDMKKLFEDNLTGLRRARAVVQNVGTKPLYYMEELMGLYGEYISSPEALHRLGKTAHEDLSLTHLEKQRILTNLRTVTGILGAPAGFGSRLCKIISQFIGAPMLVKAGLKSFSDYYYQHQYLVTAGLRSGMDTRLWTDTVRRLSHVLESKEMARHLLLNVGLKQDTILRAVTNSDSLLDMNTVKSIFQGNPKTYNNKKNFNKYAPEILKWEQRADAWANTYINKIGWVGPITEYNQSNAALSIMESLGAAAGMRYADMNSRLQKTLLRHGISQYEWDNIFSKQCVMSADAYAQKMYGESSQYLTDHNMFFADLLADMDDATIRKHIAQQRAMEADEEVRYVMRKEQDLVTKEYEAQKAKGIKVPDEAPVVTEESIGAKHIRARYTTEITADDIHSYRTSLLDRASILVNIGAQEMTSLPNARIQNMLSGYITDPNTKWGILMSSATKFQSFGMAVTQIQFGRRLAAYSNEARDNYLFKSVLESAFATPESSTEVTKDMLGFLVGCTMTNLAINELIGLTGRQKGWVDEEGKLNVDKIGAAFSQAIGILGPVYDGIMSAFEQRGKGGGITFSVMPVPSAVMRAGSNITTALTRESTEGQRGTALAGAMIQNFGDMTGLSRHALTQAAWIWLIGDRAKRWSMGDKAYRQYIRRLERAGFHNLPSLEFTN